MTFYSLGHFVKFCHGLNFAVFENWGGDLRPFIKGSTFCKKELSF